MAFPDDLLEVARHLAAFHPEAPHQASLRRAISTAYYALFHLLVSEAIANWARPELRPALGRCFDHGPMKTASETKVSQINAVLKGNLPEGAEKTVLIRLATVASAFISAQQNRNDADYNIARDWTSFDVAEQIDLVTEAFQAWNLIRNEAIAQAYLVSLLGSKERRPSEPKPLNATPGKKKPRPAAGPRGAEPSGPPESP